MLKVQLWIAHRGLVNTFKCTKLGFCPRNPSRNCKFEANNFLSVKEIHVVLNNTTIISVTVVKICLVWSNTWTKSESSFVSLVCCRHWLSLYRTKPKEFRLRLSSRYMQNTGCPCFQTTKQNVNKKKQKCQGACRVLEHQYSLDVRWRKFTILLWTDSQLVISLLSRSLHTEPRTLNAREDSLQNRCINLRCFIACFTKKLTIGCALVSFHHLNHAGLHIIMLHACCLSKSLALLWDLVGSLANTWRVSPIHEFAL